MPPSALHAQLHQDPTFGYDPWLNHNTDPAEVEFQHQLAAAKGLLYHGQDTLAGDIDLLYPNLSVYFSYVDGFGGWDELVARFPTAHRNLGMRWGYTSASNMGSLIAAAGNRRFIRESAHYGFGMHICGPSTCGFPQADWTQYADTGPRGENLDQVVGSFMPAPGPLLVSISVVPPGHPALFGDVQPGGLTLAEFAPWYDSVAIHNPPVPPPLPPLPPGVDPMSIAISQDAQGDVIVVCEATVAPGKGCGEVFCLWTTSPGGSDAGGPVWHGVPGKTTHDWVSLGVPGS